MKGRPVSTGSVRACRGPWLLAPSRLGLPGGGGWTRLSPGIGLSPDAPQGVRSFLSPGPPLLAIVIPAYKPEFLRESLASIASQADPRFRVYVGDDAGPAEIEAICSEFIASGMELRYQRFPENLGERSLTGQWNRCIALSSEPWVWLFSDDDVLEPGCVQALLGVLSAGPEGDLLRFDTRVIDASGAVVRENSPHPPAETGSDFVFARLMGARESFAVEYVMRRTALDALGGFPDFPAGWAADDAAWYLLAGEGVIEKVPGPRVRWRASGMNITSLPQRFQREKLEAAARFARLVVAQVAPADPRKRPLPEWAAAAERWYMGQLRYLHPLPPDLWPFILRSSRGIWRRAPVGKLATLAWWRLTSD